MQTLRISFIALAASSAVLIGEAEAAPPAPALPPPTPQESQEIREFDVFVKDKPAGKSTLRITDAADGTTQVTTEVKVELNYLVYVYRYEYHGRETWRGGRLVSVDNRATDDGQQFVARVQTGKGGLRIESNGQIRTVPAIDLTTNFWRGFDLAGGTEFSVMNADRGTLHAVRVEQIGSEQLTVGRQRIACAHLRVSGETEADLWVDGGNRLVRQKTVEDGYPTELRLTRVTRAPQRVAARGKTRPTR